MFIGADDPITANHVIKSHKENKKMSTILCVAKVIAETPCKLGVSNAIVARADENHPLSGTQRLMELAKRAILTTGFMGPYEYRHNRYYPTLQFKIFCKRFIKERS